MGHSVAFRLSGWLSAVSLVTLAGLVGVLWWFHTFVPHSGQVFTQSAAGFPTTVACTALLGTGLILWPILRGVASAERARWKADKIDILIERLSARKKTGDLKLRDLPASLRFGG